MIDKKINGIDHLVVHSDGTPLSPNMARVRPALLERVLKMERVPREKMISVANSYYEAILQDNGNVTLFADEEKGLVFAFSIFRHDGEPKVLKIVGVPGVTERANDYGPFELPAVHVFEKGLLG